MALSDEGSSALAMPFLMRASTVLLPVLSFWVKVTIVPSGTALPVQSRTGSVSTIIRSRVRWLTCIRKLHGCDATCWITRRTEMFPTEATNWAAPSRGADEVSIQATPLRLVTARETPEPLTERLKFTEVG